MIFPIKMEAKASGKVCRRNACTHAFLFVITIAMLQLSVISKKLTVCSGQLTKVNTQMAIHFIIKKIPDKLFQKIP